MTTFTLTDKVKSGLISAKTMQMLNGYLEQHEGKFVELTVRVSEKQRSTKQNAFYHGAFIGALRQYLLDCGIRLSHDDIHEGLRDAWAKNSYTISLPNGEPFKIPSSTARLSTKDFQDFLEEIRAHFSEKYNWQLPQVNEVPLEVYGETI